MAVTKEEPDVAVIYDYSYVIFLVGVLPYLPLATAAGASSDFRAARGCSDLL